MTATHAIPKLVSTAALCLSLSPLARAASPPPTARPQPPPASATRRAVATGASLAPGVLLHGAGHLALGQPRTALRLFGLETVGAVLLLAGGLPLAWTNASRYLIAPGALLAATGSGLLLQSWAADVYGSATGDQHAGRAETSAPVLVSSVGYRFVRNPAFRYSGFLVQDWDLRAGRLRLHPSAWFAVDDRNATIRALASARLLGPLPSAESPAPDGSRIDLEVAGARSWFASDGFATSTVELQVAARLDSERLDPLLRGTFSEVSWGAALQRVEYNLQGVRAPAHSETLLLARTGVGAYFGDPTRLGGEASVYYDHRHDGYVGGLKLYGTGGEGVLGHVGANVRLWASSHWGIAGEAAVGAARMAGISLMFRQGAR